MAYFPDSTHGLTITTTIILNIRRTLTDYNTFLQASILTSNKFLWNLSPTCPCDWKIRFRSIFSYNVQVILKYLNMPWIWNQVNYFYFLTKKFCFQLSEVLAFFVISLRSISFFICKTSDLSKRSGGKNQMYNHQKNKNKMNCTLLLLYMDHLSNYMLDVRLF